MGNRIGRERPDSTVSHEADAAGAEGSVTVRRDGAVLRLTLDRPSRRNSLTRLMIETLVDALTEAAADDSLRAIHIRGAGDDFCAGADWVATNSGAATSPHRRPGAADSPRRPPRDRARAHHPAAGGLQRAGMGGGHRLQSRAGRRLHRRRHRRGVLGAVRRPRASARIRAPPGCCPGWSAWRGPGGCCCSARRSARRDAADWGLIHQAVSPAELDDAAEELLARLASGPTVAIGLAKQALNFGQHATLSQSHDTGTVQPGTILPDSRFQRGPGGLPAAPRAEIPWPMSRPRTSRRRREHDAY